MQHKTAPTDAAVAVIPALIPLKVICKPLGSGAQLPRTGFPIGFGKQSRCHLPRAARCPHGGENSADGNCGLGSLFRTTLLITNLSDATHPINRLHIHTNTHTTPVFPASLSLTLSISKHTFLTHFHRLAKMSSLDTACPQPDTESSQQKKRVGAKKRVSTKVMAFPILS